MQIWEIGPSHLLQSPVPVHNKILNLHKYINSTGDHNNFFDRYGPLQNKAVFSASCNSPELFDTFITITMYLLQLCSSGSLHWGQWTRAGFSRQTSHRIWPCRSVQNSAVRCGSTSGHWNIRRGGRSSSRHTGQANCKARSAKLGDVSRRPAI